MKRIFLLLSLSILSLGSFAQQGFHTFEISEISTAQAIRDFSDSMRLSYPYHKIDRIVFDTTANGITYTLNLNQKEISVTFPVVWDELATRSIFAVTDSLAQIDIYNNKLIANKISHWLAGLGEKGDWQTEIALKAVTVDMNHSAKFVYRSAVTSLPKALFNQDIINLITEKFNEPYITREEAEIIVNGQRIGFIPLDTTGYTQLREKYIASTATEEERRHYEHMSWELRNVQARNQTIQQYTDSLNREGHEHAVVRKTGSFWGGCLDIMEYAGQERIYSLAPLIESLDVPEIRDGYKNKILAQLNYKDYYQQVNDTYTHILDSCIVYLKNNPELDKNAVHEAFGTIKDSYNMMRDIGVDELEIIDKLTPILTVTNKVTSAVLGFGNDYISVGTYFLYEYFMRMITNLPRARDFRLEDWDKNDIPAKRYQWLLENKGNYHLRQRQ